MSGWGVSALADNTVIECLVPRNALICTHDMHAMANRTVTVNSLVNCINFYLFVFL